MPGKNNGSQKLGSIYFDDKRQRYIAQYYVIDKENADKINTAKRNTS